MLFSAALLLMAPEPQADLTRLRQILISSRHAAAQIYVSGELTTAQKQAVLRQSKEAARLWTMCLRLSALDTPNSATAAAATERAFNQCRGDREEFRRWIQLSARIHGESPNDPMVDRTVAEYEAINRQAALKQLLKERGR